MPCYRIDNITPVVAVDAYIAPTAVLIGDVHVASGVYVGPGACVRGDFGRIIIREGANVQDNCIMHGFPQDDTVVEEEGHIGHAAVLHGCHVKKNAMVGIAAIILDRAVIEESAIVGAGALVRANTTIPAGVLAVGTPARIIRLLTEEEKQWKIDGTRAYQHLCQRALADDSGMVEVNPLRQCEENRPRIEDIFPQLSALTPKKPRG